MIAVISKLAGLSAIVHISAFPLLDTHFRARVANDPLFAIQAYQQGFYSAIMCAPGQERERPHSPYHHGNVACHAFTCHREADVCSDEEGECLQPDGRPKPGGKIAKALGIDAAELA